MDDEKEIRDLIKERLSQEKGYGVITAGIGEETSGRDSWFRPAVPKKESKAISQN